MQNYNTNLTYIIYYFHKMRYNGKYIKFKKGICMKKKSILLFILCFFILQSTTYAFATQTNISGNTSDNTSGPGVSLSSPNNTSADNNIQNNPVLTSVEGGAHQSAGIAQTGEGFKIEDAVGASNILELGGTNLPRDGILGEDQWMHYSFFNSANNQICGTETHLNTFLYNPGGFNKLYIHHSGTGRFYARTYSVENSWSPWIVSGEKTAAANPNAKVQAVQIRVKGYIANRADIYYKTILSDGTVLDWAKNGETSGSIGTGKYIVALKIALWNKEIPFPGKTSVLTQSTFYDGPYMNSEGVVSYSTANGEPYTGWAYLNQGQYYFINGELAKGWHYIDGYKLYFNDDGKVSTDLENVMNKTGDYELKFNKATKTMYVMAKDGGNGYIIPYKTFMTTAGPETPEGTYKTYQKHRWKFMHDDIYCQYLTRFFGHFLMHSLIYYDQPTSNNFSAASYNNIDSNSSDGCIRFRAVDAAWIYNNIPLGSKITVYSDINNKGPVEKEAIQEPIPMSQTFDPTDPVIK